MRRAILGKKRHTRKRVTMLQKVYPYWRFLSEDENWELEGKDLRDVLYERCTPKQYWMCLRDIEGENSIFTNIAHLRYLLSRAEYHKKKLRKAMNELIAVLEPYISQETTEVIAPNTGV